MSKKKHSGEITLTKKGKIIIEIDKPFQLICPKCKKINIIYRLEAQLEESINIFQTNYIEMPYVCDICSILLKISIKLCNLIPIPDKPSKNPN